MYQVISSSKGLAFGALLMMASSALAQVNDVRVKGAFDGSEVDAVQGGSLLVDGKGVGLASHVGRFTFTWKVTVDLATGLSAGGKFQLVAANGGDTINGSFVGRGMGTDTPNVSHIVELVSITGGTGRFKSVTGDLRIDRLVEMTTGGTSGSLTGTIVLQAAK